MGHGYEGGENEMPEVKPDPYNEDDVAGIISDYLTQIWNTPSEPEQIPEENKDNDDSYQAS